MRSSRELLRLLLGDIYVIQNVFVSGYSEGVKGVREEGRGLHGAGKESSACEWTTAGE